MQVRTQKEDQTKTKVGNGNKDVSRTVDRPALGDGPSPAHRASSKVANMNKGETDTGNKPCSTTVDRQALIDGLNHDLAGEYQAILMYIHYSAKLTGPFRKGLRPLFQAEIADEQGHAQFLADKIVALGGDPTTQPRSVPHADRPREMLEQALAIEKQTVADYAQRIRQAEAFGDIGLKVDLENQVAEETRHKEEIERILADWSEPNLERAQSEDRWRDDGGQ